MTEQTNVMQDALVSIIQKTQQGVDASVSFLSEQIPDVIQQLLLWNFAKSMILGIVLFMPVVLWLYGWKPLLKFGREERDVPFYSFLYSMFAGLPVAGMAMAASGFLLTALQIYIAPKVYLIEYAASLVK